jgi:hypothetical protein
MGSSKALGILAVISTLAVVLVTYRMLQAGKGPAEITAGVSMLVLILLIPLFGVKRYLSVPPPRRPPIRRMARKLPILLAAAPLLSVLVFYLLYPSLWVVPAVLAVILAASALFAFTD